MNPVLVSGLQMPEGPAFDKAGNLYVTEMGNGQISKITPDGARTVLATTGGRPNGARIGPDGALWITNANRPNPGRIERIDIKTGSVEHVFTDFKGEPFGSCNDLVFDPEGNCYFTDPHGGLKLEDPPGHVYFFTPDRLISRVATGYAFPNGIAITDDGATLLVAESRTFSIWAHAIEVPGQLGERRKFAQLPDGHITDGLALDTEGNVLACGWHSGTIDVFDSTGKPIDKLEIEDQDVTNLTFGGPDFSTLYVTEMTLGRIVTIPWKHRGMRLFPDR